MPKRKTSGLCTERCRGCAYCYSGLDIALCRTEPMCVYILETGRRRPCPAGDGCTEFSPAPDAAERRRRTSEAMWRAAGAARGGAHRGV